MLESLARASSPSFFVFGPTLEKDFNLRGITSRSTYANLWQDITNTLIQQPYVFKSSMVYGPYIRLVDSNSRCTQHKKFRRLSNERYEDRGDQAPLSIVESS